MGFGVVLFPFSWRVGIWRRHKKSIVAIGPIRLVWHKLPGDWKPTPTNGVLQ